VAARAPGEGWLSTATLGQTVADAGCPAPEETFMPQHIARPTRITAAGNKPKLIDEYMGRVNTGAAHVSIARMRSPEGWVEPAQRPEFEEHTFVIRGMLRVEHDGGTLDVRAGELVRVEAGERVRYSTPEPGGAEYVAVCLPAFSPDTVHRDQ
jgi:mannose-6-phosphate isomerase-like protein (cupin superfamily)